MARTMLPRTSPVACGALRLPRGVCPLTLVLALAGCAWLRPDSPVPPELTPPGVSARVLIPSDLNVNPPETVVKPDAQGQVPANPQLPSELGGLQTTFTLPDAITFALRNSPRLRSARADIQRAQGQERITFAPFLPQVDFLHQTGVVSSTLSPGIPGDEGFILPNGMGTRTYTQSEVGLEWTLYDFGRTCGRYLQSVARERVTELQLVRANQTVEFDVANAYLDVLLARASRRVQEDAVRRAEAVLGDTVARRQQGVALKDDVLRSEVQLSESRGALVAARQGEFDAVARLNNVMGRNAGWPLEVVDMESQPPFAGALAELLEIAARQRSEVGVARQTVAAALEGRREAQGEFLPRIFARAAVGHTDGENVITGWQEGAGLHIDAPLYAGGRHRGELRSADADIEAALANTQTILDAISLQVNLAYRGAVANQEQVGLARPAVEQSIEALRIVRQRYRAGTATPTDVIDAETTATRSEQRYVSARVEYLSALARLSFVLGDESVSLSPLQSGPGEDGQVVSSFAVFEPTPPNPKSKIENPK
jgi:outer membrane protein